MRVGVYDGLSSALFPSTPDDMSFHLVRSPLLYHGTRALDEIMRAKCIHAAPRGDTHVSFTTDFRVALRWAALPRDGEVEIGGILVFDRQSLLANGYHLFAFDGTGCDDEAELACERDVLFCDGFLAALRLT